MAFKLYWFPTQGRRKEADCLTRPVRRGMWIGLFLFAAQEV